MIRFGVFTDLHYAKNITLGNKCCDLSVLKLKNIVKDFNKRDLTFCICLGDNINSVQDIKKDKLNVQRISNEFKTLNMSYHIILGNHDLLTMSKSDYYSILDLKTNRSYYSFSYGNSKFIVLDANFTSSNLEYCKGNYEWDDSNISKEEIVWLENELKFSKEENIIVFTHQDLDYRIINDELDSCIINNYKEVTNLLENTNKSVTVIQGHYHKGDYQVINNVTYITLKALCNNNDISYNPRIIVNIDDDLSIEYLE